VNCKEKTAFLQNAGEGCGDAYVFTAIDRNAKLLFCFHVGRRSAEDATLFADKQGLPLEVDVSVGKHLSRRAKQEAAERTEKSGHRSPLNGGRRSNMQADTRIIQGPRRFVHDQFNNGC
jgi:hypothetical protein